MHKRDEFARPCWCVMQARLLTGPVFLMIACLAVYLASPAHVEAQALSGINGTITDTSGAVVAGAKVTVTKVDTNVSKSTVTSSSGTFNFTDLNLGTYTVKIEAPNFQTYVQNGLRVEASRVSNADAVLRPGTIDQNVTVQAELITLNTEAPIQATALEPELEAALPTQLNNGRGRQIDAFIFLAPGVTGDTFSHRINGGTDFQNEVLFNGVPVPQSETQGFQTYINPPFEMVSEFSVVRDTFSAQYGLAQGAVNYRFKTGTNQWHGTVFEIARNDMFDAKGPYNDTTPVDKEHNFGFAFGGPVILPKLYDGRGRTFFFFDSEWDRQNQGASTLYTMPTVAMKQGDFSRFVDGAGNLIPIYNPSGSGCTAGGNTPGTRFTGNIIPQACFSKNSASLLKFIPDPTVPGLLQNNFASQITSNPQRQYIFGFNIDHNLTNTQTLHYSEWRNKASTYFHQNGLAVTNPLAGVKYQPQLGTGFFLNYSNAMSNSLVMTAGFGWMGEINNEQNIAPKGDFSAFAVGDGQMPNIFFQDGSYVPKELGAAGDHGETTSINRKLGISLVNNWLWTRGRHSLNIGLEFRRSYQDDGECRSCLGQLTFSANTTTNPLNFVSGSGVNETSGSAFASFLLGQVDTSFRQYTAELRLRNLDVSPYIQDAIKINPRFTLNVGLRWDIMRPFTENDNNVVFFDNTVRNAAAGGLLGAASRIGNCPGCAGWGHADTAWKNFSPRIGFSYKLSEKMVLNAGVSQTYLTGGAYEYGTNKVAVNYGNLLNGVLNNPSSGTTAPFANWDTTPLANIGPQPFSPTMANGKNINAFCQSCTNSPYLIAYNVGLQRELPHNMFLNVAFVGNRGVHLSGQLNPFNQLDSKYLALGDLLNANINSPEAATAGFKEPFPGFATLWGDRATVARALRPFPQYDNITNNFDYTGSSRYSALQVEVDRRFKSGLSALISYNFSRMMSNTNSGFTTFTNRPLDKANQATEWTVDNNDQAHIFKLAGTYELPIGPGKRYMNKRGVVGQVLGGWQISPILNYISGKPLQINANGDPLLSGGNRASIVPGVRQFFGYHNLDAGTLVLNPAAFASPGKFALGNSPREISALRMPWRLNEDVALAKKFYFGEKVTGELRMTYFNIFNRVVHDGPNTNIDDAAFGTDIRTMVNTQRQGMAQFKISF